MLARAVRGDELVRPAPGDHARTRTARRGSRPRAAHAPARFLLRRFVRSGAPRRVGLREGFRSRSIGRARRRAEYTVASVAYSDGPSAWPVPPAASETTRVQLWPWEYLFESFDASNFPDLYMPILVASVAVLIATVIFYNVRTRQLHRHTVYLQMYEWILWTSVILFSLMIIYWIFRFDFILVLGTLVGRPGGAGLDPVPPLPAVLRRLRAAAREAALLLAPALRAPGDDDPDQVLAPAPPPLGAGRHPCRSTSGGSGSATGARTAPPARPGSRARSSRAARAASSASWRSGGSARIAPHTNPNWTWFVVIEGGGWVGVGDERTRIQAGEAAAWPPDVLHARLDRRDADAGDRRGAHRAPARAAGGRRGAATPVPVPGRRPGR